MPYPKIPDEVRAWRYIDRSGGESACWPWTRSCQGTGYGRLTLSGSSRPRRSVPAHRFIYEQTIGAIPTGMFVMHRCDNPPCCNPAHLALGTAAENSRDMVEKGRQARRASHGRFRKGKLSAEALVAIRKRTAAGERQIDLAREYDVSRSRISQVVLGIDTILDDLDLA